MLNPGVPDHPGLEGRSKIVVENIGTQRDVFMTYYHNETGIGIGPWFSRGIIWPGRILFLRVYPDGHYDVYVLDSRKSNRLSLNLAHI